MIEVVTHRRLVNRGHVGAQGGLQTMGAEGAQQDAARMRLYTLYIRITNGVAVSPGIFPMQRFTVFILATFLAVSAAEAGKMYKWVDEKGVTHFSSRQPPRENTDKTRLQGGKATPPRISTEPEDLANIKRKDFANPGWQGCASSLCRLVQQIDPKCQTSFCSRAKLYSNGCTSAACQTKKLTFKKEMQDRLAAQNAPRQQQAINANATPTPTAPASQSRD
jgi:hypothetical protein